MHSRQGSDLYIVRHGAGLRIVVGRPLSGYAGESGPTEDLPEPALALSDVEPLELEATADLE